MQIKLDDIRHCDNIDIGTLDLYDLITGRSTESFILTVTYATKLRILSLLHSKRLIRMLLRIEIKRFNKQSFKHKNN